jgi:hypothetical protein
MFYDIADGAGEFPFPLRGGRRRAGPLGAEVGRQRVEAELEIICQSADQRAVPRCFATRNAGQRDDQVALQAAGGGLAEDVEAIADLGLLEVAKEGVDPLQGFKLIGHEADVAIEPDIAREIEDALAQAREAAAVHPRSGIVLVEQRLEVLERSIGFGAGERRHQMIDDHRAGTTLGLGALARIVDDERIELRQLGPERRWIGCGVECRGLAGQPLEIAVLAVVDQGMGGELVAQPQISGDVAMWRHQVGIVVTRGFVEMIAAGGLDHDRYVAEAERRQMEGLAADERIARRVAPAGGNLGLDFGGERSEELAVTMHGKPDALAAFGMSVGWTGLEEFDQGVAV